MRSQKKIQIEQAYYMAIKNDIDNLILKMEKKFPKELLKEYGGRLTAPGYFIVKDSLEHTNDMILHTFQMLNSQLEKTKK